MYRRFRISLNNCKTTKFRDFASDFASWSQKSRSGEIGKNFKVFLSIKCNEIGINQIINLQKLQKLMKLVFIFVRNHYLIINSKDNLQVFKSYSLGLRECSSATGQLTSSIIAVPCAIFHWPWVFTNRL